MLKLPTYVEVLEKAIIAEGNIAAQNRITEWKVKRQDSIPVYVECGKKHHGICYRKTGAYFQCGKTGHMIRDCPQRKQQISSAGSPPTTNTKAPVKATNNKDTTRQGRVFALVPGDVQKAAIVVSDKSKEVLSYMLCVSSPLGDSMICTLIYVACELHLGDIQVHANLLPLDMMYFDIVLGMDWLSEYGVTINCLTKQVSFHPPGQAEFTFQGQEVTSPPYLISAAKASRLIKKGCRGYLCSVVEEQVVNGGTDIIPVVCEFSDIFPAELPG
ncbi:uncharacterized protein LOC114277451 [Camellia sinensis]|uniref:uncharacterized protein LOC114277451 n=1 Tax=Camellia sinensis TaxID=4442 RepID=UPI0010369FA6|nr:uncharacterized protein LOC114277451 [Camellia sinensis]